VLFVRYNVFPSTHWNDAVLHCLSFIVTMLKYPLPVALLFFTYLMRHEKYFGNISILSTIAL